MPKFRLSLRDDRNFLRADGIERATSPTVWEWESSTVPDWNGAAALRELLDLGDYQVSGNGPRTSGQRCDGQRSGGSFGIPNG